MCDIAIVERSLEKHDKIIKKAYILSILWIVYKFSVKGEKDNALPFSCTKEKVRGSLTV